MAIGARLNAALPLLTFALIFTAALIQVAAFNTENSPADSVPPTEILESTSLMLLGGGLLLIARRVRRQKA